MPTIEASIVEVAVIRSVQDRREFLLLQRSPKERLYPGLWQIVSGKIRPGETAVQAARREVAEETGIRPKRWWTVPGVHAFYSAPGDVVQLCPMFVAEARPDCVVTLSNEHTASRWVDRTGAEGLLVWPSSKRLIEQFEDELWGRQELDQWTRWSED